MANKKVAPPIFSNDVSYKFWKRRIQMWEVVCKKMNKDYYIITIFDW